MNCFEAQDNLSSILGQLHESRAFTDTVALRFSWAFVLALTFALACATCPHNSKKQIFTIVTSNKQKFHKNKLCADLLVFTQHRHDMLLLEPTCGSQATRLFRHESVSTSCVVVICSKRENVSKQWVEKTPTALSTNGFTNTGTNCHKCLGLHKNKLWANLPRLDLVQPMGYSCLALRLGFRFGSAFCLRLCLDLPEQHQEANLQNHSL